MEGVVSRSTSGGEMEVQWMQLDVPEVIVTVIKHMHLEFETSGRQLFKWWALEHFSPTQEQHFEWFGWVWVVLNGGNTSEFQGILLALV